MGIIITVRSTEPRWCQHHWQFPDPLPSKDGELCHWCGEPYRAPTGTVNGVPFRQLIAEDAELVQWIRGVAAIKAIDLRADLPENDPDYIGRRAAGNAKYRIATSLGWTEGGEEP